MPMTFYCQCSHCFGNKFRVRLGVKEPKNKSRMFFSKWLHNARPLCCVPTRNINLSRFRMHRSCICLIWEYSLYVMEYMIVPSGLGVQTVKEMLKCGRYASTSTISKQIRLQHLLYYFLKHKSALNNTNKEWKTLHFHCLCIIWLRVRCEFE